MNKFRPNEKCLYVIPDIHGQFGNLKKILKKILPLRKEDYLVFLGDYIDRSELSPETVDLLILLKKKYSKQISFLFGNHELLLLKSFNLCKQSPTFGNSLDVNFGTWTRNGGIETIQGYLRKLDFDHDYYDVISIPRFKVEIFIPKNHIEFFQNLESYYVQDNFLFVHGGCDPYKDIFKHELEELVWDRVLCKFALSCLINKDFSNMNWEKTIVTGHNGSLGPIITDKFLMLDNPLMTRLICAEMYSKKCIIANNNSKLVEIKDLKEINISL